MKWAMIGALASTLALGAVACTELASAPASDTTELHALQARAQELQRSVATTGQLSPESRSALTQLTADIREWNARTGRADIAVSTSRMQGASDAPVHGVSAAVAVAPTGPGPCMPCPPVKVFSGKICFLVDGDDCTVQRGLTLQTCVYVCIYDSPEGTPIKRS